jgi:CRP-like cAMP-binding protein
MSGQKVLSLKRGQELFREGALPDAMYVIKKGRVSITKAKGNTKIVLAELKPGDLLGEMAFFEKSPRSAGAQAATDDTEVIELPFKALDQQWESLPAWVKSIVKAVNGHLRNANVRIRQLERTKQDEDEMFPSHTINMLMSILGMVAQRYGEQSADGLEVPWVWLRTYTIQVFQQGTFKMSKLCEVLADYSLTLYQELPEDRTRVVVKDLDFLFHFVEFYNNQIFSEKAKKTAVNDYQLKTLKVIVHYATGMTADAKGFVKLNLSDAEKNSEKDFGIKINGSDIKDLVDTGLLSDYFNQDGQDFVVFNAADISRITKFWDIIYRLRSMQNA